MAQNDRSWSRQAIHSGKRAAFIKTEARHARLSILRSPAEAGRKADALACRRSYSKASLTVFFFILDCRFYPKSFRRHLE